MNLVLYRMCQTPEIKEFFDNSPERLVLSVAQGCCTPLRDMCESEESKAHFLPHRTSLEHCIQVTLITPQHNILEQLKHSLPEIDSIRELFLALYGHITKKCKICHLIFLHPIVPHSFNTAQLYVLNETFYYFKCSSYNTKKNVEI